MRVRALSFLLTILPLVGCKTLTVSPGLEANAAKMPVERLDRRSMAFGSYNASDIRRGVTLGGSAGVGAVSGEKDQRRFSFTLNRDGNAYVVNCQRKGSSVSVGDIAVDSKEAMQCDLASGDMPWSIELAGERKGDVRGQLAQGDTKIEVSPAHGGLFGPRGYFIRGEQELAAVDVGRRSRTVWVRNDLEPDLALALAATCTALILYEEK